LQFIDEKGLGEQLPVYVSNNPEMLPMIKVEKSYMTMLHISPPHLSHLCP